VELQQSVDRFPLSAWSVYRFISIYDLAEVLGVQNEPDFLLKDVENFRKHKKHVKLIGTNRRDIIAGLARATQTYASDILKGDTSIFPKVIDYYQAKQY
jgi:hypothetical protein